MKNFSILTLVGIFALTLGFWIVWRESIKYQRAVDLEIFKSCMQSLPSDTWQQDYLPIDDIQRCQNVVKFL